jgi:exodeoxyribonuclease VII large subunit
MSRVSKTQWSFAGDLFQEKVQKTPESVSELTQKLKKQLESGFADRRVAGEVSNLRLQGSGHAYFVLKDAGAQLACVMFRGQGGAGRAALRDGAQVILGGDITVYEPRGNYQLRVNTVEVQGVGALQAAFERLKEKLAAEGLFDSSRKRPMARYPARIGLVTSASGAAIQDVLHVLARRFCPEVILDPVRVQGAGAAQEIAGAIGRLNRFSRSGQMLDVILVTRGGGSLEDLWCFNEEVVARAIAASEVPVVSAVGHEIDFTIADFVADFRAATPSAAAEILTQDWVDSREFVESAGHRLALLAQRRLNRSRDTLEGWVRRWVRVHPRRRLETRSQRVDETTEALRRAAARSVQTLRRLLETRRQRMLAQRPRMRVRAGQQVLLRLRSALTVLPRRELQRRRQRLEGLLARLRLLSPQNVLNRGYSLTLDAETGALVRDTQGLVPGRRLQTRLQAGEIFSVVTRVSEGPSSVQSPESSPP